MASQAERLKVLGAGILCLIVTIGVSRFAYTPLLPVMQAETWLDEAAGGWLATFNYMGYMCGALLAASVSSLQLKDKLYRIYLLLAVSTTAAMAWTDNMVIWAVLRFLGGLSSSGGMLIASGLILNWLIRNNHRGELGLHFAGVGVGIILVSVIVEVMVQFALSWHLQWLWFAAFAALLSIPAWRWMPRPDSQPVTVTGNALVDKPPSQMFMLIMMIAYFCAGYGYVISATFIVDIIERQPALQGQGPMVFLLVGLAAVPAAIIWDRIARAVGYLKALTLAYGIQIIGIILPALTDSLLGAVLSSLFYGGTFIGCVSLVLTMAGRFYPTKPAKLMGKMTLSYGVAQIVAPALTGILARESGNYDLGLYLAGGFIALGTMLILVLVRMEKNEQALVG
ncbi:MAG: YbfB/YjiJ family MFS transporter [Pontibacterium sp.]